MTSGPRTTTANISDSSKNEQRHRRWRLIEPRPRKPTPIRAALISPGLALGGAERWLVSLARYVSSDEVAWTGAAISALGGTDIALCEELSLCARLHCQEPSLVERNPDRPFHRESFHKVHRDWPRAVRAACKGADVVIAWGSVSDVGSWTADLDIPSIIVSHTTEKEPAGHAIRGVTHLAAVSRAAASYFDDRPGRERFDDVSIIFNGADQKRCLPHLGRNHRRGRWGVKDHDRAVGYVGRESEEKNYLATALAIPHLPENFVAVYHSALVDAPDDHCPNLKKLAESSDGRIRLQQTEPHVGDILAGLDVLVLASHREAFSLILAEAWLAGVPVVATPVGCVPELQERFGPLTVEVPLNPSPLELASAIERATAPEGREIMARARQVALENFTCEAMARKWTTYLRSIVNDYRPGLSLRDRCRNWWRRRLHNNLEP